MGYQWDLNSPKRVLSLFCVIHCTRASQAVQNVSRELSQFWLSHLKRSRDELWLNGETSVVNIPATRVEIVGRRAWEGSRQYKQHLQGLKAVRLLRCGSEGRPRTKGGKGGAGSLLRGKTDFSTRNAWGRWGQWERARGAREPLDADRPGEGASLPHWEVCDDCRLSIPHSPCQLVSRPFINLATWSGRAQFCQHTCFLGFQAQLRWLRHVHTATGGEIQKKATVFSIQTGIVLVVQGQWVLGTGHLEWTHLRQKPKLQGKQ